MTAPVVEIVYKLTEEDHLQHVRNKLKSRFKDPLVRTKITFIGGYVLAGIGLVGLGYLLATGHTAQNQLSAALFLSVTGALSGYRGQKAYRNFYEKLKKSAEKTDWLVLRADRTGFSITRPGISESATNWTVIKSVNLSQDYLYINTFEETTYRVPTRYIKQDQWEALKALLQEIWDVPEQEAAQS